MSLSVSTLKKEGVYQASKWLKLQMLCDASELQGLFAALDPFSIFPLTGIVDGTAISKETFLEGYKEWIEGLKLQLAPADASLRRLLACAFSDDAESLWLQEIPGKGYLVKIAKPVIQVQAHYFTYSREDSVFRPMSMGIESIFWGLQFSYPQIYQDPKTLELKTAPESRLFEALRIWVRESTRATPFLVDGKKINSSIRTGKNCFSWIDRHPQLRLRNIGVWDGNWK